MPSPRVSIAPALRCLTTLVVGLWTCGCGAEPVELPTAEELAEAEERDRTTDPPLFQLLYVNYLALLLNFP